MEPNQIQQKSNGALIGSIIIIIILIIGGIYLWKNSMEKTDKIDEPSMGMGANASSSTSLDAEVNSMDLESLDNGI